MEKIKRKIQSVWQSRLCGIRQSILIAILAVGQRRHAVVRTAHVFPARIYTRSGQLSCADCIPNGKKGSPLKAKIHLREILKTVVMAGRRTFMSTRNARTWPWRFSFAGNTTEEYPRNAYVQEDWLATAKHPTGDQTGPYTDMVFSADAVLSNCLRVVPISALPMVLRPSIRISGGGVEFMRPLDR